jgi:hypothetical protein
VLVWNLVQSDTGADLAALTQYGVLGVFAILLIIFARTAYKREVDRADRLEAEVNRLNALLADKAIPGLTLATQVMEESAALMRDLQRERELARLRREEGAR